MLHRTIQLYKSKINSTKLTTTLRHIGNIDILRVNPTPIATPANEIDGILLARYLNPSKIINNRSRMR